MFCRGQTLAGREQAASFLPDLLKGHGSELDTQKLGSHTGSAEQGGRPDSLELGSNPGSLGLGSSLSSSTLGSSLGSTKHGSQASSLRQGKQMGSLRLERLIGTGSFGKVYRGVPSPSPGCSLSCLLFSFHVQTVISYPNVAW
jgi:hypothetical protein